MTIPNAGYAPWILEGRGGITVSQTGVRVVIDGGGAGDAQIMARGTVLGDDTTPTWLGEHPGFADAIIRNAEGDYTLTLLQAMSVDDSEAFAQIRTLQARADDGALTKYERPSTTQVRLLLQDSTETETDDAAASIFMLGIPL